MNMKNLWGMLALVGMLVGCGGAGVSDNRGITSSTQKTAADLVDAPLALKQTTAQASESLLGKAASAVAGNALVNNGFESGTTGWTSSSTAGYALISAFSQHPANTGTRYAWLGGYDDGTDVLYQDVTVPASGQQAALQFWYRITSADSIYTAYDKLSVDVYSTAGTKLATLASFSNLDKNSGWTRSARYDLTAYKGQTIRIRFSATLDISDSTSFLIDDVAVAPITPNVTPTNGPWWNPAESGSGYMVERQGSMLSLGAYLYDDGGAATWYAAILTQQSNGSFTGSLSRFAGGQSLTSAYKAPSSNVDAATATMTFDSATSGTLLLKLTGSSTVRAIPIELFSLTTSPAFAPSNASFQSGVWWNESQSGRGFVIEVQGNQAFIGSFMYIDTGKAVWYSSSGTLQGSNAFSAPMQQFGGGQSLTGSYRAPSVANANIGTLSFVATSSTTGNLTLPNGTVVPIKRFIFNGSTETPTGGGTGSTGGTTGGATGGTTGGTTTGIALFAGTYNLSTSTGASGSFTVNSSGSVTGCRVGTVVACSGQLTLNSSTGNANFQIFGNDGQTPVDTTARLSGTITSSGAVTGSFSGSSVSDGPFSGSLTGSRSGAAPSTGGSGTGSGTSTLTCFNNLLGTWYHSVGGTWTFSVTGGVNKAKLELNSLNYGPAAKQITELSVSACTSTSLTYTITRAALINTIDPSFAYEKTPANAPGEVDWSKVYNQPYSLSGSGLQFGNYTYAKQ